MRKKIPQLDGVRGIAVLLVLMDHAGGTYPSLPFQWALGKGWMGVDLFFVLSGFLITGILIDAKPSSGYFKNFYARRCLRIWPLYYALLFFMFVLVPLLRPEEAHVVFAARSSPWWAYPLYLQNFLVPIPTDATGLLGVTWSLAIEEQFYLAWPLVVRLCSRERLRGIAIAVIVISPALRFYLAAHGVNIYSNVFCRLDGLMAGALLALETRSARFEPSRWVKPAAVVLLIAAPLAILTDVLHARWIVFSFTALASAALVVLALYSNWTWLRVLLTNRFIVYTGVISYGLYLIQKIPFDLTQAFHLDRHPWPALVFSALASYALAALSWRFLERPFLRFKRFFESSPPSGVSRPPVVVQAELG